ncbi:cupin-like domain-domain-containing protein [Leucosporidium creatinivorum]|uniref:Cupin-like domain-domain-containing protein n=1 Tax=Leucosporidium creatinivorum TaxID=106004 RepID=A0A1Y2G2V5_9BASI|nr:cupin-like domain-domain-containing protein [Leucosporidium creatinivorum]
MEKALQTLIKDYQDLNSSTIAEIDYTPSPLEFSRFVGQNRPLVIRGQGQREQTPALEKWSNAYLVEKVQEKVAIAVSPEGNADSIVNDEIFVEPATVELSMQDFLSKLDRPQPSPPLSNPTADPVYYLQSQNGNLGGEYEALLRDVGAEGPSFAREVFAQDPDACNLWIGDQRSVTSLHKDPYENIYLVIRGSKTFTLLPPAEFYCLHEQIYPHATYNFTPPSTFSITSTTPSLTLPWIPVDPHSPDLARYPRFAHARPIELTLQKGDMLYLPALWFHRVAQDVGDSPASAQGVEGEKQRATIAVNWWYDMDMSSPLWSFCSFLRKATLALDGRVEDEEAAEGSVGSP